VTAPAVRQLPARAGKVPADRLAIDEQCGDGLAELPSELSVGTSLALVDLCAFGMDGYDHGFVLARRRRPVFARSAGPSRQKWQ